MTKQHCIAKNIDRVIGLTIVMALVLICYFRTLWSPFYFDDYTYILGNPFIRTLWGVFDSETILRTDVLVDIKNSVLSRPLTYFSFALNYFVHKDAVAGYHFVNILIHLVNACLVYCLIRTLALCGSKAGTDAGQLDNVINRTAFFCAALFAVHPVMTSAVTYIIQRMASLGAMFFLLCMACYFRAGLAGGKLERARWYVASLVACFLAMKVRETSFMLPIVLLMADLLYRSGTVRKRLIRLVPFFAVLFMVVATLGGIDNTWDQSKQNAGPSTLEVLKVARTSPLEYFSTQFYTNPNMTSITSMSPNEYLITQFRVIVTYERMLLVPLGLNFVHDYPFYRSLAEPAVLASLLLHLTWLGVASWLLRKSQSVPGEKRFLFRVAAFGIFWFYLCLVMESSIIPMDDLLLEYRMYLPAFGILVALVALLQTVLQPLVFKSIAAGLVIIFMVLTVQRNEQWRDPLVFWQDAQAKSPNKHRIHGYIGNIYRDRGDMPRALMEYRLMLAKDFRYGQDHFGLGELLLENGFYHEAVEEYLVALKIRPDKTFVYDRLAEAYHLSGDEHLAEETRVKAAAGVKAVGNEQGVW